MRRPAEAHVHLPLTDSRPEVMALAEEAREAFRGSPLEGIEGREINRFDEPVWDLEHLLPSVRSSGNRRLYFTVEGSMTRALPGFVGDPFKAFIVHKHGTVKTVPGLASILSILRKLWEVLQDARPVLRYKGPNTFRWETFSAADLAALETLLRSQGQDEHVGAFMAVAAGFAEFLQSRRRPIVPRWTYRSTPSSRNRHSIGTPEQRAAWRRSRLPHSEAITALAEFYWSTRPARVVDLSDRELMEDRLMICLTAIYLCGGFRVTEGATLPSACLGHDYEDGEIRQFLRYGNLKARRRGGAARVRWLSPLQSKLVTEAVREILEITAPWRDLARELERCPERVILRNIDGLIRNDDELIDAGEAARLLGLRGNIRSHRPELIPLTAARGPHAAQYRLGDVARVIQEDRSRWGLTTSVRDGSHSTQTLSESLLVVPVHFLARSAEHHPVLVEPLSPQKIAGWLSGAARYRSIFEKLPRVRDQVLRVRTHQFRHLVNYLAKKRGMSDTMMTIWMQRADPRQNAAYAHDAPSDVAARILRERIRRGEVDGPLVDHLLALPSAEREDVLRAEVQAAHETSIGTCKANFVYDPCEYFGACLDGCKHLLVERGSEVQLVQISGMRRLNEEQLHSFDARAAAGENLEPAHRARLERVIEGCLQAERRIENGAPDGTAAAVFPEGEDHFTPFDTERYV